MWATPVRCLGVRTAVGGVEVWGGWKNTAWSLREGFDQVCLIRSGWNQRQKVPSMLDQHCLSSADSSSWERPSTPQGNPWIGPPAANQNASGCSQECQDAANSPAWQPCLPRDLLCVWPHRASVTNRPNFKIPIDGPNEMECYVMDFYDHENSLGDPLVGPSYA